MAFDELELRLGIFDAFENAQELTRHGGIAYEEVANFCCRQRRRIWTKPTKAPKPPRVKKLRARKGDSRRCPLCGAASPAHRCAAFKRIAIFDPPRRPPDQYRYVWPARAKGA